MNINNGLVDEVILGELGERLMQRRIARGLTQAMLAKEAGVAKRTVERVEAGESIQLLTLVRLCRVLDLLEGLDQWLPEARPSPMALLKQTRKRASPRKMLAGKSSAAKWKWSE